MILIYITAITKSVFTLLAVLFYSMFFFVIDNLLHVVHWLKQKASLVTMPRGSLSFQIYRHINPHTLSLMDAVARTAGIPTNKITGFMLFHGRWHIRLEDIGWLRTSDLLQMQIKLYTTTEEVK